MKNLLSIILALAPSLALAQNYSIDWSKIAGGGGTSSGGNYTLTGTIGQTDAGTLSGGNYTLEGGFLSGIVVLQTLGAPQLSIVRSGSNATISWAADAGSGYILQETTSLGGSWGTSGATVNTIGNTKSVTVPATGIKFYRLIK
jgi:hypothetical protein